MIDTFLSPLTVLTSHIWPLLFYHGLIHRYYYTPKQCAYLFLSLHCKFEPSHHQMQGQPVDQWEICFGNLIQAVIGRLLGEACLLITHHAHTLFKDFSELFHWLFSTVSILRASFRHLDQHRLHSGQRASLQGGAWLPQTLTSGLFEGRNMVLLPSDALLISGLKHIVVSGAQTTKHWRSSF